MIWWPFFTFQVILSLGLLGQSSEIESIQKMSISFFDNFLGGWGSWGYISQVKSTFGKINIPKKVLFLDRGREEGGYITQVKSTFRKIYIPKHFFISRGWRGVHHPSQIYLQKNLHPKTFFSVSRGGREGVHHPSQIYLQKNLHPKTFFTVSRGGRQGG